MAPAVLAVVVGVVLIAAAYRAFLWRCAVVRKLTGAPLLAGTWRGTLESSYTDADGSPTAPLLVALLITQGFSKITATLFTAESSSVSTIAALIALADGRWSLTWSYENAPRPSVRGRSERHRGTAEAVIGPKGGAALIAHYYTDRLTSGELVFVDWSPTAYSTFVDAFEAEDFSLPRPFA